MSKPHEPMRNDERPLDDRILADYPAYIIPMRAVCRANEMRRREGRSQCHYDLWIMLHIAGLVCKRRGGG